MDDIVVVTLFRHGLTLGNQEKRYMGWNDSPLCEDAIQTLSSYKLSQNSYDLFVSSDLLRCLSTLKILFPNVEPIVQSEFREMNFGEFQGHTYDELKNDREYQLWIQNHEGYSPPKGESFQQFQNRIETGWKMFVEKVIQTESKSPLLVTHGGVIRYLLTQFAPVEKSFWEWTILHGMGLELTFEKDALRRGEKCILLREVPLTGNDPG